MTLEQLKFLAGAAEAVQSRNTGEMKAKGECLIWLAEQIEIETANVEKPNGNVSGKSNSTGKRSGQPRA